MGYTKTAAFLKFSYLLCFKFSCNPVPGALCSTKSARFMGQWGHSKSIKGGHPCPWGCSAPVQVTIIVARVSSVTLLYLFSSELALKPDHFNPGFVCVCFFVSSIRTVWTTALRQEDETQERSTLQHSERATWITLSGKKYRKNSSKRRKIGVSKVTHRCSITDKSNPGW